MFIVLAGMLMFMAIRIGTMFVCMIMLVFMLMVVSLS
jgi:hypothetical protein